MEATVIEDKVEDGVRKVRAECEPEEGRRYTKRWNFEIGSDSDERIQLQIQDWLESIKERKRRRENGELPTAEDENVGGGLVGKCFDV